MNSKRLQIRHLDDKLRSIYQFEPHQIPGMGWIRSIRQALNMSQKQLAQKLGMTPQGVQQVEKREGDGRITLASLRDVAQAMDMELVYGFVPRDGSLENLVARKARVLAEKIIKRTSQSMALEDQAVSEQRQRESIQERTGAFTRDIPRILWD